jgi:hypothetical protein
MTLLPAVGAFALLLLAPATVPPMTDQTPASEARALTLDVRQHDGGIEVELVGLSPRTTRVSYSLEVTGQSTSRHRGSTTLAAGTRAVLSTMRASAGASWCVTLVAEEEGRDPYEITQGSCAPD